MIRIISVTILCNLFFIANIRSQTVNNSKPGHRVAIFFNPFSAAEFQQAAIGAGIAYKQTDTKEFAVELNYLFTGPTEGGKGRHTRGGRIIFTEKFFFGGRKKKFFMGGDVRFKAYTYRDTMNFVNYSTHETLSEYGHQVNKYVAGIAFIGGAKIPLTRNKRLLFEFNVGVGPKIQDIERKVPDGFVVHEDTRGDLWKPYREGTILSVYFPAGARLFYFF